MSKNQPEGNIVPHCGICQVPVTDWKAHMTSPAHLAKLKEVAETGGLVEASIANKVLADRAVKRLDEAMGKLRGVIKKHE